MGTLHKSLSLCEIVSRAVTNIPGYKYILTIRISENAKFTRREDSEAHSRVAASKDPFAEDPMRLEGRTCSHTFQAVKNLSNITQMRNRAL